MPWITKEGRTVEEAQESAVAAAGRPEDELEIEVVSEGAKGLFGLGGEPAIVRVRPRDEATDVRAAFRDDITPSAAREEPAVVEAPPRVRAEVRETHEPEPSEPELAADKLSLTEQQEEASRVGAEMVSGILERMGLSGDISTRVAGGTVYIEVFGDDMGILIGRGGTTLEALQEVVRAGVQRRLQTRQAVVVDVEAYWERRRKTRGRRDEGGRRGNQRRGGGRDRPSDEGR